MPKIDLHVEPGMVKSWDAFRRESPPCSIALDGYVNAPPLFDPAGPFANFDHHCGVNRLATRSTTGQVMVAIHQGLFDAFRVDDTPTAHVFVNDCDQDICLAYWLLTNPDKLRKLRLEMDIAQLIIIEDLLDATAGAIPVDPQRPMIRKQAWVFELYDNARAAGHLAGMSSREMTQLIEDTAARITMMSNGESDERQLIGDYDVLGGDAHWRMIHEHGQHARTRLLADGIRAFVAVRQRSTGRYDYTIGRMSPFVHFPLDEIFRRLNDAEGITDGDDRWGGGDTIGGSPRKQGSCLPPSTVEKTIAELVKPAASGTVSSDDNRRSQ